MILPSQAESIQSFSLDKMMYLSTVIYSLIIPLFMIVFFDYLRIFRGYFWNFVAYRDIPSRFYEIKSHASSGYKALGNIIAVSESNGH